MKQLIYAADDEKDILEVIEGFLENAGFDVCTFSTGDALYEAFREKPCDLVVLDIMMPGRDGLTICRELRAISDVPIVILTAKESETDHMRGFMLGGDDYLIKPFSPSLLVVRIQALLRHERSCTFVTFFRGHHLFGGKSRCTLQREKHRSYHDGVLTSRMSYQKCRFGCIKK